jgi:uncharacterized protein (DUF58 family)
MKDPLDSSVGPSPQQNGIPALQPERFHPTPLMTSRLVQLFLLLFLLLALIYQQRDFALFMILLLGITLGADLWSRRSLHRIQVTAELNRIKIFPGEGVQIKIHVKNAKWLPVWLRIELPDNIVEHEAEGLPVQTETRLLWFQSASFEWTLTPEKRGVYVLGPPKIWVGDLMGFYPRRKASGTALHLIVFPRLVPVKSFSIPRRDYFGTPGAKSPVWDPVFILGTREYQSWQPARYIHWKASSRQPRIQQKIFEPSEQAKVLLMVAVEQFALNHADDAFENTLEIAASLAVQWNRRGFALGFMTDGAVTGNKPGVLPVAYNARQLSMILETLARLQMRKAEKINDVFHKEFNSAWGVSCARFAYKPDPMTILINTRFKKRKIPTVSFYCEMDTSGRPLSTSANQHAVHIENIRLANEGG